MDTKRTKRVGFLAVSVGLLLGILPRAEACRDAVVPGGDWIDNRGKIVSASEGGIVRYGNQWYMWGMDRSKDNSTFEAVVLYKSPDLVHWTYVKEILKKTSHEKLNGGVVVERAKILHCPKTGKWVMWMHYEGHNAYNQMELAYATADSIDGDYAFQNNFQALGIPSRDINVYQENGVGYVLATTLSDNSEVHVFQLDSTYTKVVKSIYKGTAANNFNCEGHSIVKSGDTYYWLMSWCTWWYFNDNHYYTAKSLAGPWTYKGNLAPAGASTYESQVGWAFPLRGENGTDFVYMGDRWSPLYNFSNTRMVMLPLVVKNGVMSLPWQDRWYPEDSTWREGVAELPDGVYRIRNRASGLFLQPTGGSKDTGIQLVQGAASNTDIQSWKIENLGGSNFRVSNVSTGLRMSVQGASSSDGAKILQSAENGKANEKWHLIRSASDWWRFVAVGTMEKTFEIQNAATAAGAGVVLGSYLAKTHQQFELVPVNGVAAGSTVELVARHSGKVATVSGGSLVQATDSSRREQVFTVVAKSGGRVALMQGGLALQVKDGSIDDGAPLVLGPDTGSSAQWMVSDAGGGWVSILNGCTGKGLDVSGGATGEGIAIKQFKYTAGTNQQWKFKTVDPSLGVAGSTRAGKGFAVAWRAGFLEVSARAPIGGFEVLDASGRTRFAVRESFEGRRSVPIPGLEPGAYLVQPLGGDRSGAKPFVVF